MSPLDLAPEVLAVLRSPTTGAALEPDAAGDGLVAKGAGAERFTVEEGFLTFAKPDVGKYEPGYAKRYAALWAYGSESRHLDTTSRSTGRWARWSPRRCWRSRRARRSLSTRAAASAG